MRSLLTLRVAQALVVLSCLGVLVIGGVLTIYTEYFFPLETTNDKCTMTYSRPNFRKMELEDPTHRLAQRYSFYRFQDTADTAEFSYQNAPVIFIPGNRGAHAHGRTLGRGLVGFPATVYVLDFNAETAALSGSLLKRQAEYLNQVMKTVSYTHDSTTSLTVVGHSMGSIVALVARTLPSHDGLRVATLLALASPLARPVVGIDALMIDLYRKSEALAKTSEDMLLVSVSGGFRDAMVPSPLVVGDAHSNFTLNVLSKRIPQAGVNCDHQSILWCGQVSNVTSELVMRLLSAQSKQADVSERLKIAADYLIGGLANRERETRATTKLGLAAPGQSGLTWVFLLVGARLRVMGWNLLISWTFAWLCLSAVWVGRDEQNEAPKRLEQERQDFVSQVIATSPEAYSVTKRPSERLPPAPRVPSFPGFALLATLPEIVMSLIGEANDAMMQGDSFVSTVLGGSLALTALRVVEFAAKAKSWNDLSFVPLFALAAQGISLLLVGVGKTLQRIGSRGRLSTQLACVLLLCIIAVGAASRDASSLRSVGGFLLLGGLAASIALAAARARSDVDVYLSGAYLVGLVSTTGVVVFLWETRVIGDADIGLDESEQQLCMSLLATALVCLVERGLAVAESTSPAGAEQAGARRVARVEWGKKDYGTAATKKTKRAAAKKSPATPAEKPSAHHHKVEGLDCSWVYVTDERTGETSSEEKALAIRVPDVAYIGRPEILRLRDGTRVQLDDVELPASQAGDGARPLNEEDVTTLDFGQDRALGERFRAWTRTCKMEVEEAPQLDPSPAVNPKVRALLVAAAFAGVELTTPASLASLVTILATANLGARVYTRWHAAANAIGNENKARTVVVERKVDGLEAGATG